MNLKKNKFIIGLSTTLLASVVTAGGEVAHASTLPEQTDLTPTNDIIENVVDEYNQVVDDTELEQLTEDNTDSAETNEAEVSNEESAQASDSSETDKADATDENEASTTNETEQTDTAENTDQATEASSEEEEALLTEPSATTEDPAAVEEAEEPETEPTAEEETPATDQNLDTEVEAGAVVEDEDDADTARTEADPVDEDSTEKAQELEANTESLSNKETAAATSTEQKDNANVSADTPQETPAGDEPLKEDPEAGDAPLEEGGLPKTEESSDLTETEEGATLPLTSEGAELPEIQTLAAGDAPLTEAGAESPSGDVNIAVKEGYTDPQADAANIKNKRETDLTPGDTAVIGGKDDLKDPKDGFKLEVVEPTTANPDKRLYGYELIIDKETGQRTYTWIQVSSAVVRSSPTRLGTGTELKKIDMPMIEVGDKLSESLPEVTYKATGPSTLSSGSQNVYGYKASKEDLEHINNKDNNSTVLGMKDYYTKDNVNGPHVLAGASFEFKVNPWPDENDNLEPIRLQGNYDKNKKVYVHGQEIDTGLKVENLDANARDRLTAKVYNTENGEIVPGAEVYIDAEGNVKVKLPDGAVDESGNINPNSIFYDDPKFNGAQSLDVKLYVRPRTAGEFQNVAAGGDDNGDDSYNPYKVKGTYVDTGAGTTTINHKGVDVTIANQGIDRYDHYNLIGEFEINLDDESNYDIITKDITTDKIVTDKLLRLKAGVDKEIKQVDNPNSTAPHKYTTAITDKAVDSYLEPEYEEFLIPVEGEVNKYRTTDNWLVEVDPDNPQNMKVSTPIGAKKGENLTLAVTHLFTNGSEKNFLMNFVVKEESIEKPDYGVAVTEAGQKVDNTPTNEYTESKPKPVKYELESTSIVDDNGKTWTLSIDEKTGVITATAPAEIVDRVSTINAPVIAIYEDQKLTDKDGNKLVYTERSNAAFTATAPQEGEVTYSQDNIIEYETIVRNNPEKDPTQSGVVQEGKNGKYTVDYKVTYKNGEVVEGPTMVEGSERDRVEPIPQIFEIGTKGASVDVTAPDEQTIKIPYTTEIIYDANQPVGYRYETPGEDGEKKITYEIIQQDGKATVKATETTTKEVTPRRIIIGTKPSELGVDFNPEIDVKVDNTKEVGSVDTEVVQGEYKTVTKNVQNPDGSIVTIEEVVEITKPKQIITVGTKDYTGNVSHTDKKDVPFEVKYEYTDQLDAGVTELKNDGVLGEKTVTYTVPVINGKKDPNKEITSEETQTKDPVDKVILVGTRPVEKTIEIPFETEYVYDSSLEVGQTVTDENNPGVTGKKKVTTSFNQTTNNIEVTEETVTEAQKRIVRVGGKTTGTKTVTEKVPFTVEIRENPALKKGEYKVIQDGVVGEKEKILTIENSTVTNTAEGRTITEAKNQIIEVGSADFTGEVTHEVTEEVPFTVRIVEDSTMAPGTHKVVTEGQAGSKTTRYTQNIKNGAADGELKSEEIVTATTKAPVEEVIHVGTAAVNSENTATSGDIPVDITYTYDPTKERGTAEKGTFTPGKVETKIVNQYNPETGKIETKTEETVTNAKQEIIVGTKDYTGEITYTEREFENYDTIIKVDNTKAPGYRNVDQEGKVGVTERDVTRIITNGTAGKPSYSKDRVTPKQDQIITVGALTEGTNSYVSDIPFAYTVEYDESIPAGEYRIEKPGVVGKKRTTWTVRNSEVVETNEEIITNKEDAIIKVSSKAFAGTVTNTVTQQLPYEIEIVESADLPVGTRFVRQEGEAGSVDITYSQDVKNGAADGAVTTTESNRVEPKKHIIVVGTKPIDTPVKPEITIEKDPNLAAGEVEVGEIVPGKVVTTTEKSIDPLTGKEVVKEVTTTTPATQTIKVGTKAYDGKVEYKEQRVTPFETEIIFDDSLAPGKEVVEQAGINKVEERTITQNYSNGTLTDKEEGEFTTATEGQKQVIRVGTMTNGVHRHEEKLPFGVKVEYNENIPAGQYEVVVDGKEGVRVTRWTIENSKVVGDPEVLEVPATDAIIRVGTKAFEGVIDHKVTEKIPFTIEFVENKDLALGETRVKEEGVDGSREVTYHVPVRNGEKDPTKEITSSEGTVTQPKVQIVEVGTKIPDAVSTNVGADNIGVDIVYEYDPNLDLGKTREGELTPGKVENTVTTVYNPETGKLETVENKTVTNAKQVIYIGTKALEGKQEFKVTQEIPFTTEYEYDPTLTAGERVVKQQGVNGTKTVTYTAEARNGSVINHGADEVITKEPVTQIIRVGTKAVETRVETVTTPIPYETTVVFDENMPVGEHKVETKGVAGSETTTTTTTIVNGQAQPNPSVETTREEPTTEVIKVGSKVERQTTTKRETITVEVPYATEIQYDDTVAAGSEEVVTEGVNGVRTIVVEFPVVDGEAGQPREISNTITTQPTTKVIKVGTKGADPVHTETKITSETIKEQIPYTTIYQPTDELEVGETRVATPGKMGVKNVTIYTEVVDGVEKVRTSENIETEPVAEVVLVGTRTNNPTTDVITKTTTETIPFKTITIEDPNLEVGTEIVDVEGVYGEKEITITIPSEISSPDDLVVKESIIKESTPKVVRVGTKKTTTRIEEKEVVVPYETEIILDDTLKDGEREFDQAGETGTDKITTVVTIVNGQDQDARVITTERTKDPVKEIVRVGTRRDGNHSYEEDIPFEVIVIEDKNLKDGEYVIEKEGVVGKKTTTWEIVNSKVVAGSEKTTITKPAENAVIRVGTADHTGTVEYSTSEELPFEVEIVQNPDLAIGKHKVRQKGIVGSLDVTYEIDVVNGKASGEPRVKTSDRVAPVKQIIEVGTKPVEQIDNTITTPLQPEFKINYDNTKDKGTVEVGQLTPGKVETKITQTFNPETGQMESKEETVVTNPTQTITIGTKDLEGSQTINLTQVIPFETKYEEDPTLEAGQTVIEQNGINGEKTITYYTEVKNGQVLKTDLKETVTKEAQDQIIRVGTRKIEVDTTPQIITEAIQYETKVEVDNSLAPGERKVVTKGVMGERVITVTVKNENGKVITETNTEVTKEPVTEVIKVGPQVADGEVVNIETKPIPYETEIIFDNTMDLGTSKEENPGKEGTLTITFTTPVTNGVAGETVRTEERTEEPVNRVVRIGTKTNDIKNTVTNTEVRRLDYETEVIFDDTLDFGETEVVTEGEYGEVTITFTNEVVNGVVSPVDRKEVITKQPVTRVVKVGTRNVDTTQNVHIEAIPHETEVIFDDTLELGESVVEKEGKDGQKAVTYTNTLVNGVVTTEKSEKIIENPETRVVRVGTKTSSIVVSKSTKPIAPETEVIFDPDLPLGESVVEEEGVDGVLEITHTVPMENGVAGDVVVTEKVLKAPTTRKVRIGTKTDDVETEVVNTEKKVIRHEVEIISDPTLPFGEIVIDEVGEDGELTVTFTTPVVNGVAGETVREEKITKEPKTQVVRVGSKDDEVVNTTTKVIPHETEVIFDPELPLGDSKVETEGRDGVITVTHTTPVVGGKAGKTVTTEEITTEPITRVVRVGTKTEDAKSTVVSTTEKVVPFETEVIFDKDLELGKSVEDQAGENGVLTETHTTEVVNGVAGKTVVTSEITKEPTTRIVRVGTKTEDAITTVVNTVEKAIPHETEVIFDKTLALGESVVETEGSDGVLTETYTTEVVNGVAQKPVVTSEITKQPVTRVVRVGTMVADVVNEVVTTEEKTIPYETEVIFDDTLELGEFIEETAGVDGKIIVTSKTPVVNGVVGKTTKSEEIIAPITRVVRVGTKTTDKETEVVTTTTKTIAHETEVIFDDTLPLGKSVVDVEGQDGELTVTHTTPVVNGVAGKTVTTEEITKAPVTRVVRVGTKVDQPTQPEQPQLPEEIVTTSEKVVPYEVEIIYDDTLDAGEEVVEQEGANGKVLIIHTTPVVNGELGETKVSEKEVKAPVKRIVRVGTKSKDTNGEAQTVHTRVIPKETKVIFDENLPAGDTVVDVEGQDGEVRVTTRIPFENGVAGAPVKTEEVIKEKIDRVIRVGKQLPEVTQPSLSEVVVSTHEELVPFETEIIYDENLEAGKSVITGGENGVKLIKVKHTITEGDVRTETTEEVIKQPVKQVIRIGRKVDTAVVDNKDVVSKTTVVIPFETEVKYDPNLPADTIVVEEDGKNGLRTITVTVPVKDGIAGEPIVEDELTTPAINRVIRVGTKAKDTRSTVVSTTEKAIPFETEVIFDKDLELGESIEEQAGENGVLTETHTTEVVNGVAGETVVTTERTKEPVKRIVRVGTKTEDARSTVVSTTEKVIPFETEVIFDKDLELGKSVEDQAGENGVLTETHTTEVVNGVAGETVVTSEITKEPTKRIVRVGTKTNDIRNIVTNTEVRRLDYETEVIFDDTLDFGETEVVTEGEYGEVTITFTNEVVNGVVRPVDRKEVITKQPVTRVVRVGTRTTQTTSNTVEVEIPFETEIITDNTLNAGEQVIDQVGKNGKKTVTVRNTIENGVVKTEVVENIVEEPTKQIVRVGTKCPDKPSVTNGEITETSVIEIPFTTRVVEDPSLDAGQIVEDQKGVPGKKTVTVTIPIINGVAGEAKVDIKETIAPVERVIRVGTKKPAVKPETPKEDNDDIVSVTEVPEQFETEIIYDDTLPAGKVVEEQKGINGVRTITTIIKIIDGKAETTVTEEVTKEAQKRIIRIGTKTATNNDPIIDEKIVEIPFETIVTYDPDLEEGKARVIRPGQKGEKTITTITKIVDGKEVTEVVEVITKQPVDEIRVVGRKVNPINPGGTIDIPSNQEDDDKPEVIVPGNEDDTIINTPDVDEDNTIIDTPDVDKDNSIINPPNVDEDNTIIDTPDVDEDDANIDTPDSDEDNATIDTPDTNDEDVNEDPSLDEESDNESDKFKNKTDYDYDIVKDSDDRASSQRKLGGHDSPKTGVTASHDNPKTGIAGTGATLTALGISLAGLRFSKKKKEDDKE